MTIKCYIGVRKANYETAKKLLLPKLRPKIFPIWPYGAKRWEKIEEHQKKPNFSEIMCEEELYSYKWVVEHDLKKLEGADCMLAFNPMRNSTGVDQEVVYAYEKFKIPVFSVVNESRVHHPWTNYHSVEVVSLNKIDKLIERIIDFFEDK